MEKEIILSVVIIAKNAESLIEDAIRSVDFAQEIIVVDGGSTDRTNDVAKKLHAKIIKGESNNFAEQRNIGAKAAKGKWILYIDTDERVSASLRESIQFQISNDKLHMSAFKIKRKNFYLGNHEWPKIEQLERLFRKDALKGWYGALHETAKVEGQIGVLDGYLLHYTHRDLESMLDKTIVWSRVEAQLRLDSNHPKIVAWRLIRVMLTGFFDSYVRQGGWRVGTMGLIESIYQSYSMFVTYATLWEMQTKHKK
ncbi:MAG TPA: glycosyltransferase family 2 protein [Candidatus Eisenbacteria bacterium]|nr:glycosyltransferase family 2 protein [Candidatus Eisenbacteria bacterium]